MRFHRRHPYLQHWLRDGNAATIVTEETLAFARLEPTLAGASGAAALDLIFSGGDAITVVPFIDVEPEMLLERERSPLIWPYACNMLSTGVLAALEERIVPWLQSLTLARQTNAEAVRAFDSAFHDVFQAARDACFLGAAPYADVFAAAAPYVYAARFADGARVSVRDDRGGTGAALLGARANVCADLLEPQRNALARHWFGSPLFGEAPEDADVGISRSGCAPVRARITLTLDDAAGDSRTVTLARPVPNDVLLSFDPEDSAPAGEFGVRVAEPSPLREWSGAPADIPAGGSAGRILLLLREDWHSAPDADTDEALALAARLRAEGFTVRVASPTQLPAGEPFDLVHAFTLDRAPEMSPTLERLRAAGTPVVATANFARTSLEAAWGPSLLRGVFAQKRDEAELEEFCSLIRARAIADDTQGPQDPQPFPGYDDAVRNALAHVNALLVGSAAEEAYVRERFGFMGSCVQTMPYCPPAEAVSPDAFAGTGDFVLVHAPVDWRAGVPLVVRAAVSQNLPVVVVGPPVDGFAYRALLELGGDLVRHAPRLDDAEMEGLYRRARVYADMAWAPYGLSRLARAAASGCRLAVSRQSRAAELFSNVRVADPADEASVAAALSGAWHGAPAGPALAGQQPFLAIVSAYAAAQQACRQA